MSFISQYLIPSAGRLVNPFQFNVLEKLRDLIRFLLWVSISLIVAMFSLFAIFFVYEFLCHSWQYCMRTLFSQPW